MGLAGNVLELGKEGALLPLTVAAYVGRRVIGGNINQQTIDERDLLRQLDIGLQGIAGVNKARAMAAEDPEQIADRRELENWSTGLVARAILKSKASPDIPAALTQALIVQAQDAEVDPLSTNVIAIDDRQQAASIMSAHTTQ